MFQDTANFPEKSGLWGLETGKPRIGAPGAAREKSALFEGFFAFIVGLFAPGLASRALLLFSSSIDMFRNDVGVMCSHSKKNIFIFFAS